MVQVPGRCRGALQLHTCMHVHGRETQRHIRIAIHTVVGCLLFAFLHSLQAKSTLDQAPPREGGVILGERLHMWELR